VTYNNKENVWANFIIAITLAAAIIMIAFALFNRPAAADGMRGPPPPRNGMRPGLYPQPVGPQGSPSCLMTALQLGYLTGRRELAYSATEACMYFAGSRGVQLPYGFYGPYVPSGWVPPDWALPVGPPIY
jgi:hypothetical protein